MVDAVLGVAVLVVYAAVVGVALVLVVGLARTPPPADGQGRRRPPRHPSPRVRS